MPYRVEVAAQGRAGCKNKECKDAAVKIDKGEFRMGTLITVHEHQSWTWKHWGCVTPLQISHLQEESGGDTDMVDGYDELPPEFQAKVDYALEHGHVPDEDWKGDVECNRPGAKGFRVKVPKAKKTKQAKADKEEASGAEEPKSKKKRGRPVKEEIDDEEEAPAPKKARGVPKKAAVKEEVDEEEAPVPKKARGRPKKAAIKEEVDEEAEAPAPKKARGRPKKVAVKNEEEVSDAGEDDESEAEDPKPQRGRKARAAAADSKETATPKKRGRKKKSTTDD